MVTVDRRRWKSAYALKKRVSRPAEEERKRQGKGAAFHLSLSPHFVPRRAELYMQVIVHQVYHVAAL